MNIIRVVSYSLAGFRVVHVAEQTVVVPPRGGGGALLFIVTRDRSAVLRKRIN